MIRRLAGLAVAVAVAALVGTATALLWPLPSRRGTAFVPGLAAEVSILYDRQGVPHIRAIVEDDAWRALGFAHATDRLFQMEMRRRAAVGRLAEVLGPPLVETDRDARRYGYAGRARDDLLALDDREREALQAYADGVNAFLASHALPLELRLLGIVPEPWTPLDSLAFGRLMQRGLTMAPARERAVWDDARRRGVGRAVALLDATEPGRTHVDHEVAEILAALPAAVASSRVSVDTAPAGSNAWALAGSRTASGKPLLAGDPHLNAERPGVWYAAHLTSADGLDVAGLTLAGTPGVVIGHNGRVAWSLTMNQADDADLVLERLDPTGVAYLRGATWVPLARRTETIAIDGADAEPLEVEATERGPIVERIAGDLALVEAWISAGLPQGVRPFLDAARAKDGEALLRAWSGYRGPAVNLCWADASGRIGLKAAGAVPRRARGDGRFPVPGWVEGYAWEGPIPFASLPEVRDPADGIVTTANDDWGAAGVALPFPGFYAGPDRARRARALASTFHAATVADMRTMQRDVLSPYAVRVVAALGRVTFADPRAIRAAGILRSWNARAEARGPSRLFFAFMKELRAEVAAPLESGTAGAWVTWSMLEGLVRGDVDPRFWDDPGTAAVETGPQRIERALARSLDTVRGEEGDAPERWSWGRVHRLSYPHPFAGALPAALSRRLAFGPVELAGEWHTLAVAGFSLRGDGYRVFHIPSARLIVDLAAPDATRLVLPLGQSGQLLDRHAASQLRAWSAGRDFPFAFTRGAVDAATRSTMRLLPADTENTDARGGGGVSREFGLPRAARLRESSGR